MEIKGYKRVSIADIPGYDSNNRYAINHVIGGCMDSEDSPIRIADGANILGHWIGRAEFLSDWEQYRGRVVMVSPQPGIPQFPCPLVKQFLGIDYGLFLVLRMYKPFKEFSIPVDYIKDEILIIDRVI